MPRLRDTRKDQRRLTVQPTQALADAFQLGQPGPFRPSVQFSGFQVLVFCLQGLAEQAGLSQHAFPFQVVGLPVVLVPGV